MEFCKSHCSVSPEQVVLIQFQCGMQTSSLCSLQRRNLIFIHFPSEKAITITVINAPPSHFRSIVLHAAPLPQICYCSTLLCPFLIYHGKSSQSIRTRVPTQLLSHCALCSRKVICAESLFCCQITIRNFAEISANTDERCLVFQWLEAVVCAYRLFSSVSNISKTLVICSESLLLNFE